MNRINLKIFVPAAMLVLCVLPGASRASASVLNITPAIVDEKAQARDTIKETVTIRNTDRIQHDIYPVVMNVDDKNGYQKFTTDLTAEERSASLANWINIVRNNIVLKPGEERTIDWSMKVDTYAKAGNYHAVILFLVDNPNQSDFSSVKYLTVNLEVFGQEKMQLLSFFTDSILYTRLPVSFNYILENIGDQGLTPAGEIRIYDRRGEEIDAIPVNTGHQAVPPSQKSDLAENWMPKSGDGSGGALAAIGTLFKIGAFGRYKAMLDVQYGSSGTLQDTVFFWVLPLPVVAGITLLLLACMFGLIRILKRSPKDDKDED